MRCKSALIIVPHPDDEINLAGGLFDILRENGVYTTVVICTNGDFLNEKTTKRYYEAKRTQKIFKYDELVFLGYGDGYVGTHIYDAVSNVVVESRAGYKETYCAGDENEFCFIRTGRHNPYTRESFKNDIRDVILTKQADLVVCVDLDKHPDHRCISLLFDECMGEILKSNSSYRPVILKGFAYNGVWLGPYDFFDTPIKPTRILLKKGETIREKCFPHDWNQRIQIKNGEKTQTLKLWNKPIFNALCAQKTQNDYKYGYCALNHFPRLANPDSCYWYRSPFNLALSAQMEVSSGDAHYLNDFMLAVPEKTIADDLCNCSKGWCPALHDKQPTIALQFPKPVSLSRIVIYQNCNSTLGSLTIRLNNGFETEFQCPQNNVVIIQLPPVPAERLTMQIASFSNLTINEIECYESGNVFPWDDVPFTKYENHATTRNKLFAFLTEYSFKAFVRMVKRNSQTTDFTDFTEEKHVFLLAFRSLFR